VLIIQIIIALFPVIIFRCNTAWPLPGNPPALRF